MTTFLKVKNRAASTLASGIDDEVTELTVATGEGTKFPSTYPFHITIDDEILSCTNRSTDVLTVEREAEGTVAAAHSSGATVSLNITAEIVSQLQTGKARSATKVIAAYNSSDEDKIGADYVCDGTDDDEEIQDAFDALTNGGTISFAAGHYKPMATITRAGGSYPLTLIGAGPRATQIIQMTADTDLFQFGTQGGSSINGMVVRGMSLGTVPGTGDCFKLWRIHRSTFEDIQIKGAGRYCFFLGGCLLNTFKVATPSVNLPAMFDATVNGFNTGFYTAADAGIYANGNTFVGCVAEGGNYGWYFTGTQGGSSIFGGVAEGQTVYGVYANGVAGLQIKGLWCEVKGIYLEDCAGCSIDLAISAGIYLDGCHDCHVQGHINGNLTIDADCLACIVERAVLDSNEIRNLSFSSEVEHLRTSAFSSKQADGLVSKNFPIIKNGNMESWAGGLPLPFQNYNTATITQTGTGLGDTTKRLGDYACKVTKTTASTFQGLLLDIPSVFKGQWISIEFAARTSALNGIVYRWNGNEYRGLPIYAENGVWQKRQMSFFFDPSYSFFNLIFMPNYADDADSIYFDTFSIWAEFNPYPGIIDTTDGDTTPRVDFPGSNNVFKIANTEAKEITNFDNGYIGQRITLLFADVNTTINNGGNFKLTGNFVSTADDVLVLVFDGSLWYEVSRSVN